LNYKVPKSKLQEQVDRVNEVYQTDYSLQYAGMHRYELKGKPMLLVGNYTGNEMHTFLIGLLAAKTELLPLLTGEEV